MMQGPKRPCAVGIGVIAGTENVGKGCRAYRVGIGRGTRIGRRGWKGNRADITGAASIGYRLVGTAVGDRVVDSGQNRAGIGEGEGDPGRGTDGGGVAGAVGPEDKVVAQVIDKNKCQV